MSEVSAAAVVCFAADGRILLVNGPRGVALPCGKVEPGERASAAAVREAQEETGVAVRLIGAPYVGLVGNIQVAAWAARPATDGLIPAPVVMERGLRPFWGWPSDLSGGFTPYNLAAVAHATAQAQATAWGPGEIETFKTLLELATGTDRVCLLAAEYGVRVPQATLERLGYRGPRA